MVKMRVLLVDDHAILREGLRALLSHYEDVEVVGEAQDGIEALTLVERLRPDIVIMDIAMPGTNGIEATRLIHQRFPQTRVLVLTQHDDWRYIKSLLQVGAAGYVTKRALGVDLINALRTVFKGETFLQPSVASILVDQMCRQPEPLSTETLTPREQEVLKYIVRGLSNCQIAHTLSISVKTVEWHRSNLMSKLGVHNVADLVRYAIQYHLVSENE
jgi:two-component system response regulator NreC